MKNLSPMTYVLVVFALTLGTTSSHAQTPTPPASAASSTPTSKIEIQPKAPIATPAVACAPFVDATKVSVTQVSVGELDKGGNPVDGKSAVFVDGKAVLAKEDSTQSVRLRQVINVKVDGLETLLEKERCSAKGKKIVLYLDDRPLVDRKPYPPKGPHTSTLQFELKRNEASREVWTHLLGKPTFESRAMNVSVGLEDEYAVPSKHTVPLEVIPIAWFVTWSVIFVVLLASFWALAAKSDMLRDAVPAVDNKRKPYSLARTQAAVWFFLILASYLFIGLITGDYSSTITGTVLGLMGISAGTAIGSSAIDFHPVAKPAPAAVPAPVVGGAAPVSSGIWWLDILSDGKKGVTFHRFQMASWTLVLGIVFIQQVYDGLAMPDFSATLLGLLGISAGTYLGLKSTSE